MFKQVVLLILNKYINADIHTSHWHHNSHFTHVFFFIDEFQARKGKRTETYKIFMNVDGEKQILCRKGSTLYLENRKHVSR